jgi:hypothetical protein
MIKLKNILNESSPGFENRQVGDALPTLDSVRTAYQAKKSLEEAESFTAINKDSGKVSVFKSKDARDSAIKGGTHDKKKGVKGGDSPPEDKDVPKVNIFDKPEKENTPKKDAPKSEPSKPRAGNPQVNKVVSGKAKKLGITPQKLGKEEYEKRMSQAAVEALTDANFHSESRALIAVLEDNPELAKNPSDDPNKPDMFSDEYDEWKKGTAWASSFGDSSDGTDNIAHSATGESSWDGQESIDAIAFDLKMNGSHKLAAKIQSIFDEKNESTTSIVDMIPESVQINEDKVSNRTVSTLEKGIKRILGTEVNHDINDNGAHEFYVDDAEFVIGVGEDETKKSVYSFHVYDDGGRKYLGKDGYAADEKDLIKQVLSIAKKYKKQLLLTTESVVKEAIIKEGFGMWEMSFADMNLNGVKLSKKNKYKVKARNTVEAIKKAAKMAGLKGGDWLGTHTHSLKKIG